MKDEWKIITHPSEIKNPGIYQEKIVVIPKDEQDRNKLIQIIKEYNGELCEPPENIANQFPLAICFWRNKIEPEIIMADILRGNIRIKIN